MLTILPNIIPLCEQNILASGVVIFDHLYNFKGSELAKAALISESHV